MTNQTALIDGLLNRQVAPATAHELAAAVGCSQSPAAAWAMS
jgi:hypothetical protein